MREALIKPVIEAILDNGNKALGYQISNYIADKAKDGGCSFNELYTVLDLLVADGTLSIEYNKGSYYSVEARYMLRDLV